MIARGVWQLEQFGRFVGFVARTLAVLPRAVVERFGEVLWQFEQVAVKSLPIVLGAGISVGLVTWLQTHRLLVANGAESALPSFLAVAVVVEIGPVLAGVLVASRMGAGLAAELGSMRLNEEIEARIVLGADPVPSLVAPRAIACALAVPLLDGSHRCIGPARGARGRGHRGQALAAALLERFAASSCGSPT